MSYNINRHHIRYVSYSECLTISSDEEDEGKIKKSDGSSNNIFSNDSNSFNEEMETILEKEPVITNNSVCNANSDYTMESEDIKGIITICFHFIKFLFQFFNF